MGDYDVTLGFLTASVREIGGWDTSSDPALDFISDGFVRRRVNRNYKGAYELLASADPDRVTTESRYTLASATGSFPLPADMFRLRSVSVMTSAQGSNNPTFRPLERHDLNPNDGFWDVDSGVVAVGTPWCGGAYRTQGQLVHTNPSFPAGTTFRLTYVPVPTNLTGSDQVIDGTAGLEELTIWTTVKDCLIREKADTGEADGHIAKETARITAMGRDRDSGQPGRLEDPLPGGRYSRRRGAWR